MKLIRQLRTLFRKDQLDAEMTAEMQAHVDLQAERNVAAGMKPEDARFAALRQFGNVASIQEQAREVRGWLWLEQARQDLAYSARQLLRLPGFTATIIVTLALGIGACTVVFTAINATLLSPLAGQAVNGAVIIHETEPPRRPQMQLSPGMFADVAEQAKSFEGVTAWTGSTLTMQTDAEPVFVRGAAMTPGLASNWSPSPALGRPFTAEEEARGDRVIMISHGLWQRSFRGSPDVLNRVIDTDMGPYTVIGVIHADFAKYGSDVEFWTPWALSTEQRTQRNAHFLQTNAKLKPGVTLAQAQAELNVIAANVARQYPDTNKGVGLLVRDMGAYINRSLAPMLYLLLAIVGCVLLIACSNVANLLLARAASRQREMAVRMALGAGRGRLVRQLLVESVMLATLGGAGGIVLAKWAIRFLQIYGPSAGTDLARLAFLELEPRVVAFTVGFSVLTGIVFGLAPAWFGSGVNHQEALKQGGHGSTDSKVRAGLRTTLVVVEIALALALLAGAGLLVRSFTKLAEVDPGFAVREVATMRMVLSPRKYTPETRRQFVDKFLERVQALPGVEAAALANMTPFNNPPMMNLEFPGRDATPQTPIAVSYFVTPDYLPAMGIRLLRGRGFTRTDLDSPALALVVSETFAKQYFPDEDPLGRTVALVFGPKNKPTGEIVGVARDVMQVAPGQPVPPQLYVPRLAGGDFHVLVRIKGDPEPVLPLLKSEVHALDKAQPVIGARTMAEAMSTTLARSRLMLSLLAVFSGIAFVLAAVGIYSVMAYAVGRRTTEFGIRMALGASRGRILADVLHRGLTVVALGLVLGTGGALALGQVLQTTLYEISPRDPVTLGASLLLLFTAGFLACLLPARRATKVDPIVALRAE
jgi:predicted permease